MQQYRVKDWEEFQHYKDRSPPWIRLHKRLLDNYRFHSLPDASRALAPMLWLLASENNDISSGVIDGPDEEIAFRLRRSVDEFRKAMKPLIEKGFIEAVQDASDTLADCQRVATSEAEAETDREETEKEPPTPKVAIDYQRMADIWNETAGQHCTKVGKLTDSRRRSLQNRLADSFDGSVEKWRAYCETIQKSGFLTGGNDRGWKADFDWALKPLNAAKVMEGRYAKSGGKPSSFAEQDYSAGTKGFLT
ncbi:hypothetical protein [Limnoglobus roseus]|uniref:Uncharacterized protein n=1 Tax=Limnoglobus roseus TaxID=2598579 RepID=A0A5C1ANE3_9BACT|nr:hypothetical protein [Limnoglobus roseus]QEL18734.1 hypothetical protein PX52LOC_05770 [Limnoglobus roseus]